MRFNNLFSSRPSTVDKISNIGMATFSRGYTDKNHSRTPHYEIKKCIEMYATNPIVQSACEQLKLFIMPNKNIKIQSEDPETVKFLEEWHNKRKGIKDEYGNILLTNLICGNGPMEKHYKTEKGKKILDNIFSYNNMGRLFINPDDSYDKKYILELDVGINKIFYDGMWQSPMYHQIRYMRNYSWFMDMKYGIYVNNERIAIYRSGWSIDNIYGRSGLASAIDSNNILNEILSSWDTISKTRQLDHKLFSIADNEAGGLYPQEVLDELAQQLNESTDSYHIINVPLKNLTEKDIKVSGNYDLMTNVFDILRRMVMMSLLPQHLTPWNDTATTQGSEAAMPPFLSRVKAKQNEFIEWLNSEIICELRKTYTWLAEDATFIFEEPNIIGHNTYVNMVTLLISSKMISANEGRHYLVKMGILDEDYLIETDAPEPEEEQQRQDPIINVPGFNNAGMSNPEEITGPLVENFNGMGNITLTDFKKKIKNNENLKELDFKNIGGKSIRLLEDENNYYIYNGFELISTNSKLINKTKAKDLFNKYCEEIGKQQDILDNEESEELLIIEEAQKELSKIIKDRLDSFFDEILKNQTKKESFLSKKIFKKLDDKFKGLLPDLNSIVSKVLNRLGVVVIEIKNTEDDTTKQKLYDSKDMLIKNIQDQIKLTRDETLQDIKNTLSNGIAAGKTPQQIRSEITKQYNYENGIGWKFDRAFFTSVRQSAGILNLRKWKDMGLKEFSWHTREDEKVRKEHIECNNKVFKIDDALEGKIPFPGGSLMPGKPNINCRCRAVPYS